jgi:putative ATPase
MKQLDYGKTYKYTHDFPGNFTAQEYMPNEISGTKLYDPGDNPREQALRQYLKGNWKDKYDY